MLFTSERDLWEWACWNAEISIHWRDPAPFPAPAA